MQRVDFDQTLVGIVKLTESINKKFNGHLRDFANKAYDRVLKYGSNSVCR